MTLLHKAHQSTVHITSQTCPVLSYLHAEGMATMVEIHRPRSESGLRCFQSSVSVSNLQISLSLCISIHRVEGGGSGHQPTGFYNDSMSVCL